MSQEIVKSLLNFGCDSTGDADRLYEWRSDDPSTSSANRSSQPISGRPPLNSHRAYRRKRRWRAASVGTAFLMPDLRMEDVGHQDELQVRPTTFNRFSLKRPSSPVPDSCRAKHPATPRTNPNSSPQPMRASSSVSRDLNRMRIRKLSEMRREKRPAEDDDSDSDIGNPANPNKIHVTEDYLVEQLRDLVLSDAQLVASSSLQTTPPTATDSLAKLLNDRLGMDQGESFGQSSSLDADMGSQKSTTTAARSDVDAGAGYDADDENEDDRRAFAAARPMSAPLAIRPNPHPAALEFDSLEAPACLQPCSTKNASDTHAATFISADCMVDDSDDALMRLPERVGDDFFYHEEL